MFRKLIDFISLKLISPAKWTFLKYFFTGRAYDLKPIDREYARKLMSVNNYLWVNRRETHLTTYLIGFADWALSLMLWAKAGLKGVRPKYGYWSHAFMNSDDNEIVEAVAVGVHEVFFDDAFDCDSVAALLPTNVTKEEWDRVRPLIVQELKKQKGKKYDTVFNVKDEGEVSCIELMRLVLMKHIESYSTKFAHFEQDIKTHTNLTPQMLYDCKDFTVVWEVRY